MEHLAILKKGPLDKILSGDKTIESRWYTNKKAPYNKIKIGEKIYFSESGKRLVTVTAFVKKVLYFNDLDEGKIEEIFDTYSKGICTNFTKEDFLEEYKKKRYCILVFIRDIHPLDNPFRVIRSSGAAWKTANYIDELKV